MTRPPAPWRVAGPYRHTWNVVDAAGRTIATVWFGPARTGMTQAEARAVADDIVRMTLPPFRDEDGT